MSHFSQENLARFPKERFVLREKISCDASFFSTVFISFIAYLSPILFLLIPVFRGQKQNLINSCHGNAKTDCETNILSIILKLLTMAIASYWLFWQKSRIVYPRTHWPRLLTLGLMLLVTGIYWLFYAVKI